MVKQTLVKCWLMLFTMIASNSFMAFSQETAIKKYLEAAGDYAVAYNGEIGTIYNPYLYTNTPYLISPDYTTGDIYFQNTHYPNQQVRLDLYKDQLILLTAKGHHGVVVDPRTVKRVVMYNKTFIWHTPPEKSGLKTGYYMVMADGEQVKLLCKIMCVVLSPNDRPQRYFSEIKKYYILYNDSYYPVSKNRSFNKIFPSLKKQIKAFNKSNKKDELTQSKISSEEKKELDITQLAIFCNEQLKKQAKQ